MEISEEENNSEARPAENTKTPTPAAEPEEKKSGDKSSKSLLYAVIIIFIALLAAVAGAAAMWFFSNSEESESETPSESSGDNPGGNGEEIPDSPDAEEAEEEAETTAFTGDYVTGDLPDGWTIIEYENGLGSDLLTTGTTYVGLTGLEILNPSDEVVLKLEAVWGIGGIEACSQYYQFPDNSTAYYNDTVAQAAEVGVTPTVVTFTEGDYVEYELLGTTVRRVGTDLYWDKISGNSYFEAACGMSEMFLILDDISYDADTYTQHDYQWTLDDTTSTSELLQLDTILESLAVI